MCCPAWKCFFPDHFRRMSRRICLAYAMHLPSICLAYARSMPGIRQGYAWHTPGMCLAYARHMLGICLAFARHALAICQAYVWHVPGICLAYARPMPGRCLAFARSHAWHIPGISLAHARHTEQGETIFCYSARFLALLVCFTPLTVRMNGLHVAVTTGPSCTVHVLTAPGLRHGQGT